MKNKKTCCIISNDFCNFSFLMAEKKEREKFEKKAVEKITALREEGVNNFFCSLEEGLDLFIASYIEKTKGKDEKLYCAVAFEEQASSYGEKERELYFSLCERCDTLFFVSKKRIFGCKTKRDKYMIEQSDSVLCFWDKFAPYTGELLQYAANLDKKIVYI